MSEPRPTNFRGWMELPHGYACPVDSHQVWSPSLTNTTPGPWAGVVQQSVPDLCSLTLAVSWSGTVCVSPVFTLVVLGLSLDVPGVCRVAAPLPGL